MKTPYITRVMFLLLLILSAFQPDGVAWDTEERESLPLVDAVELAIEHYPSIGAARAGVEEAGAATGEAWSEWLPSLSFSATAARYSDPMPVYPIHGFTLDLIPPFNERIGHYGLNMDYTLFDGGGRLARLRLARSSHDAARASLEETRQELISEVVSVYLEVLSAKEVLAAHTFRISALESELSRIRQHFQQERAARVEVLRVEAALAGARADRVRAYSALDVAERNLALLVGVDPGMTSASRLLKITLSDSTVEKRDRLLSKALASNPSVERARLNAASARAGLSFARSARLPRLQLVGNYFDLGDFDGNRVTEWKAEASVSFPLFTGGLVSKRITGAKAAYRSAEEGVKLAEYGVKQQLDRVLAVLDEARARVASLSRAVYASEEVAKIERLMLEVGVGTQTDYLDSEANLVSVKASLIEARHREIEARVGLARVTGELDTEWISRYLENRP
jgi:outer membrane protein